MNKKTGRIGLCFLSFCGLIALDQWTKYLSVIYLKDKTPFVILNGVFELRYLENTGAAFGMLKGHHVIFYIVAAAVFVAAAYVIVRLPSEKKYLPLILCAVLIASGAVGNVIDRVLHHYVIDFLYFKLIDFPIFNVADCYVTVSTGALLVLLLFGFYSDEDLELLKPKRKESKI